MITRDNAVEAIMEIINAGILREDLEEELNEIMHCIDAEQDLGIHAWGMPDEEWGILCTAVRTDLPEYREHILKQKEICQEYEFMDIKAAQRIMSGEYAAVELMKDLRECCESRTHCPDKNSIVCEFCYKWCPRHFDDDFIQTYIPKIKACAEKEERHDV